MKKLFRRLFGLDDMKTPMIEVAPSPERWMSYSEAILYCQFCDHGGHKDWRIPTIEECVIHNLGHCWVVDDQSSLEWYLVPVRTI